MMVRIEYEGGRTTLFDTLSFTEGSPFSGANMLTDTLIHPINKRPVITTQLLPHKPHQEQELRIPYSS